jgi:hypothetical protein
LLEAATGNWKLVAVEQAPLDRGDPHLRVEDQPGAAVVRGPAHRRDRLELAAIIAEEAFEYLDAPMLRIASVDAPAPYAPPLEAAFLPSVEKVVAGAKTLVKY